MYKIKNDNKTSEACFEYVETNVKALNLGFGMGFDCFLRKVGCPRDF